MRLLSYGDRAVLVELDSTAEAMTWAAGLRRQRPPEVADVVPAARTALVVAADDTDLPALRAVLARVVPPSETAGVDPAGAARGAELLEVPTTYDGPDLDEVARHTGLTSAEVVEAHTARTWQVAFGGFAPGFGYLVTDDDRLHVPRRTESRTRVSRGSVGLAGEYSGIYPTDSPGGWQLIGRTDLDLFDADRDPPALLRPGVAVRFVRASG